MRQYLSTMCSLITVILLNTCVHETVNIKLLERQQNISMKQKHMNILSIKQNLFLSHATFKPHHRLGHNMGPVQVTIKILSHKGFFKLVGAPTSGLTYRTTTTNSIHTM